jgi:hypothetical protein
VYGADGRTRVTVDGPAGTDFVIDELHRALTTGAAPAHDGMWGLACLELCAAVREASRSGEFVTLAHQAFPAGGPVFASDERLSVLTPDG